MAVRRTEDGSPDERFADLMGDDVTPVPGPRRFASPRSLPPSPAPQSEERVQFSIEIQGEEMMGIAAGADPAQLAQMRRGEIAWRRSVDLHGLVAEQARKLVRSEITEAARAGERVSESFTVGGMVQSPGRCSNRHCPIGSQSCPREGGFWDFAARALCLAGPARRSCC